MESSRVSVAHKRKLSGPSTWPRVLKAAPKREPPRTSLSGRLTERQQLALALEESRKDSLPQQQDQQEAEHALQRCDSGEQSSSLQCCDDEVAARRGSSKRRVKQQHGRTADGMPSSPCRTNSHEQASTSGRAGAVASMGAAKTAGTLFSSSMSSGTSKQSASTGFKIPFSRSRHGAAAAPCPPISVPDAESDPSPSDPASPVSQPDRLLGPANVSSSSTSELTGLQTLDALPPLLQPGDLPTESAALSNDPQADHGHSERLGSLTPSVSHSASPSSLEVHHPCKKLRRDSSSLAGMAAAAAFPSPAARPAAAFKNPIRVKLGAAEGPAKAASDTPVASPLARQQTAASLQSAKRLAEPGSAGAAQGPAAKRLKVEQRDSLDHTAPGRSSSFRKPRSKSVKGKLATGGRGQAARPSIPPSVFEEPVGEHTQSQQLKTQQPSAPASCLLKACSQLVDLDRRSCDEAATCLPRNSAFLDLKREEEDSSESDDEEPAATATVQQPPPEPPLAYFADSTCDVSLASELTSLRLADSRAGGKPALDCSQESLPALPTDLGGKLSKARHACLQSVAGQAALLPTVADCCSFLYRPLRAAAASRPSEMKTFSPSSPAAASKPTNRDTSDATTSLPKEHVIDVLNAVKTWIER